LLFEGFRHASEAEPNQPLFGWMCEHFDSFLFTRLWVASRGSSQW
jgi:predicted GNAT superfamily acetyltransferase